MPPSGELAGPVGERNSYSRRPKGTILCVARDAEEIGVQRAAVQATGNLIAADPADSHIAAVLFAGSEEDLRALNMRMAGARGADRAGLRRALSRGIPERRNFAQHQHRGGRRQCQPDDDRLILRHCPPSKGAGGK